MLRALRKKKRISIQWYLTCILIFIIVIQGTVLLTTLVRRDFYTHLDEQIMGTFVSKSDQQISDINGRMTDNVKQVLSASELANSIYTNEAVKNKEELSSLDLSENIYDKVHVEVSSVLLNLLDRCIIDSAFILLNNEGFQDNIFIEIVNKYPELQGDGYKAYQIRTGSTQVSKTYGLGIHENWELSIDNEDLLKDCFTMPYQAIEQEPFGTPEKYGYWNFDSNGSRNGETTYTLPLINEVGECYGVIGIGISRDYFHQYYVNEEDYNYENNFYAIGLVTDELMVLSQNIPNTNSVKSNIDNFKINKIYSQDNIYEYNFKKYGESIVKVDALSMYSTNSPFKNQELSYLTIVSKNNLKKNSISIKNIFAFSFILAALIGMVLSVLIAKISTLKINGLAKSITNISNNKEILFNETGFTEIDKLTDAIKVLNDRVIKSNQTINNLLDLTELNLGGFESDEEGNVHITEYVMRLLGIEENTISTQKWNSYYKILTKEVIDQEQKIYHYSEYMDTKYIKITQSSDSDELIGMILDVTKEIEDVLDAQHKLDYDPLTGLYSRTAFYRIAQELIEKDPYKTGCVIFIDMDNLKFVNDSFGHDYGDMYLNEGSKIFARMAKGNGIAARMSGDEFAIYLHGYYSKDEVRQLIYMHFEESRYTAISLPDGSEQRIRYSSGISWYSEDSTEIEELVKYADFAMYDAKHTIKGTHREFNQEVYNDKIYMMENSEAINKLIEEQLVCFMFQPIVSLRTGEIYAYEMLMRSELDVFKSPLEILQVATAQFKLKELEEVIIKKALSTAYSKKELLIGKKIFINSIASEVLQVEIIQGFREMYGEFLEQIVIEITESEDIIPEKMKLKIDNIKEYGMEIALDDFGSGYSNELRIISIGPDVVKLDMELVQGVSTDIDKQVLCSNIITYCHERNIKTVCEGVECKEDLEMIIKIGADLVQGYYVQRPAFEVSSIADEMKDEIIQLNI